MRFRVINAGPISRSKMPRQATRRLRQQNTQVDLRDRMIVPTRLRLQQGVRGERPVVGLAELRQL